jgi:hypothetical protein
LLLKNIFGFYVVVVVAPLVFGVVVAIDIVVVVAAFGTVNFVIPVDNCFSKTTFAINLLLSFPLLLLLLFLIMVAYGSISIVIAVDICCC